MDPEDFTCEKIHETCQALADNLALRARVAELEAAITWALGAGEDFPTRQDGQGAYWWRSELQDRAGMTWDGEKFIH